MLSVVALNCDRPWALRSLKVHGTLLKLKQKLGPRVQTCFLFDPSSVMQYLWLALKLFISPFLINCVYKNYVRNLSHLAN